MLSSIHFNGVRTAIRRLTGCILIVALLALSLTACGGNTEANGDGTESAGFQEIYSEAYRVEQIIWPEDQEADQAEVLLVIPDLAAVYQAAIADEQYDGSNLQALMTILLKDYQKQEQISIPASYDDEKWTLNEVALRQEMARIARENANAFLVEAFSDMEPIEINLEVGDVE